MAFDELVDEVVRQIIDRRLGVSSGRDSRFVGEGVLLLMQRRDSPGTILDAGVKGVVAQEESVQVSRHAHDGSCESLLRFCELVSWLFSGGST